MSGLNRERRQDELLFTADSLADIDSHDGRNWGDEHFAHAMTLAFDAVLEM